MDKLQQSFGEVIALWRGIAPGKRLLAIGAVVIALIAVGAIAVDVLEDLVIRSRWNATGAGRADAKISGGDLSLEGVTEVTTSECWDSNFGVTFAITTPQIVDLDHSAGAESACPAGMQEASYSVDASIL